MTLILLQQTFDFLTSILLYLLRTDKPESWACCTVHDKPSITSNLLPPYSPTNSLSEALLFLLLVLWSSGGFLQRCLSQNSSRLRCTVSPGAPYTSARLLVSIFLEAALPRSKKVLFRSNVAEAERISISVSYFTRPLIFGYIESLRNHCSITS